MQRTHIWTLFRMWLNPVSGGAESNNKQDYTDVGGKNEAALCRAVAKDGSKQGGSHGDRCVSQQSAEWLPWGWLCDTVVMETGVSGAEGETKSERALWGVVVYSLWPLV